MPRLEIFVGLSYNFLSGYDIYTFDEIFSYQFKNFIKITVVEDEKYIIITGS